MWELMQPYWADFFQELGKDQGLFRMFLMMTPLLLVLEVPLYILVLMGVFRWYTKKVTLRPKKSIYTPKVSCLITCYSEGYDVQRPCCRFVSKPIPAISR